MTIRDLFRQPKAEKKDPKDILAVQETHQEWMTLRRAAQECSILRTARRLDSVFITGTDGAGEEELEPIDLTVAEDEAIRRYLLRNRLAWLRSQGVDV